MLEPINNKITQLPNEERGSFKLKANLGGSGKSIHQRVIKKIHGREAGLEVILYKLCRTRLRLLFRSF